jgi:hypothetical protein
LSYDAPLFFELRGGFRGQGNSGVFFEKEKIMKRSILCLTIAAGLAAGSALAEPLKVKPGLWEITTKVNHGDVVLPPNINQLTPEQRVKVEAKLAERNQQVLVKQSCLTQAQLDKGEAFMGGGHHQGCSNKAVSQTGKEWVTAMECTGKISGKGEIRIQAADPEHMTGTITMTTKNGATDNTTKSSLTSKWLGADCSSLSEKAPKTPAKK